MDKEKPVSIWEFVRGLNSQDPRLWRQEFGEEYGLVEPERDEWNTQKEFDDFKQE